MRRFRDMNAEAEQDKDLSYVGGRIRYARLLAGMTQDELGKALPEGRRKSRGSIAQYELKEGGNSVSLEVIEDIAAVLGEDPRYLAFGGSPERELQSVHGQQIPLMDGVMDDEGPERTDYAVFPSVLVSALGASKARLGLVPIVDDAPAFGFRKVDFLLIDVGSADIKSDGKLYAVRSPIGALVVRSEHMISRSGAGQISLTTGKGTNRVVEAGSLNVMGLVVGVLHRQS